MDTHQFTSSKSLVCLLQGMQGKTFRIELRNNGKAVYGRLDSIDYAMNCNLSNGYLETVENGRTERTPFNEFYLQGKNIRYVLIPDCVSIYGSMNKALSQNERLSKPQRFKKAKDPIRGKGFVYESIIADQS